MFAIVKKGEARLVMKGATVEEDGLDDILKDGGDNLVVSAVKGDLYIIEGKISRLKVGMGGATKQSLSEAEQMKLFAAEKEEEGKAKSRQLGKDVA